MIDILDPKEGETIYDPACGTGGLLLEAVHHVKRAGGNVKTLRGKLYGQEKNLTTSSIAQINLYLHGVEDFQIIRNDTLRYPAFFARDHLATFDCVIANPPFSLERWGEEIWTSCLFNEVRSHKTPIVVECIVNDIDEIVRIVMAIKREAEPHRFLPPLPWLATNRRG